MLLKSSIIVSLLVSAISATQFAIINTSTLKLVHQESGEVTFGHMGEFKKYDSVEDGKVCFSDGFCTYQKRVILIETDNISTRKVNTTNCNLYNTPDIGEVFETVYRGDIVEIVADLKYGWSLDINGKYILTHLLRTTSENANFKRVKPTPPKPKKIKKDIYIAPAVVAQSVQTSAPVATSSSNSLDEANMNSNHLSQVDARLAKIETSLKESQDREATTKTSMNIKFTEVTKKIKAGESKDKFYISKIKALESKLASMQTQVNNFNSRNSKLDDMSSRIQMLEEQNALLQDRLNTKEQ